MKIKHWIIRLLIVLMCIPPQASYAQALPSTVQRAISGIIQAKMLKRGFAANDPRFAATVSGVGSSIVGAAAAAAVVTAVGVTAPAWVTVGATVALGSLFAAGISIAADKTINWLFNSDGTVNNGTTAVPAGTQGTIDIMSAEPAMATVVSNSIGKPWIVITTTAPYYYTKSYWSTTTFTNPGTGYSMFQNFTYNGTYYYVWRTNVVQSTTACPSNYTKNGTQCVANGVPAPVSPTDAVNALTDAQKAKASDPVVLQKIAQSAWEKAAAQPGYTGFAPDPADPITEAEVQKYKDDNPATWPPVGDIVSPQPLPSGTTAAQGPFSIPAPTTATNPGTGTGTGGTGTTGTVFDWSIIAPNETVQKTEASVSYNPIAFSQTASCPAPLSYEVFGDSYPLSFGPMCDWLSSVCAPLSITLATIAAAFIFARGLKR